MTIKELHSRLIEAYTISNLNRISLTLINLFRNGEFSILQKISEIISDNVIIKITDEGKGFAKLMMLYHPDRAIYHINEINRLASQNRYNELLAYSHILKLENIEEVATSLNSYEDIDYSPVYEWDMETDGFSIIYDSDPENVIRTKTTNIGYNFYDAIKIREFGNTDVEYPSYYLEDIEDFELSCSDINDLDGIQFCINAKTIDVSSNRISDLTPLSTLVKLEEINLSDNQIGFIDALSNLQNLKSIFLANNYIDDIAPLLGLTRLEYVDLSGNNVDTEQINKLTESGVIVNFDV